jgi:hypothetical protein
MPLMAIGLLSAGCASNDKFASLTGPDGACSAFQAPTYVVKGKSRYDQQWVDTQTEAGVAGCGWERPKPRPPSLDAKPVFKKVPPPNPTPNAAVKKRWWPL